MAVSLQSNVAQALPQQAVKLDALPLRAGQVVEARVVTSGQGGNAQLSVGNVLVDAALQVKLQEGALVRLLVQGSTPNIRLTVLPNPPLGTGQQGVVQLNPQSLPAGQPAAQNAPVQAAQTAPASQSPAPSAGPPASAPAQTVATSPSQAGATPSAQPGGTAPPAPAQAGAASGQAAGAPVTLGAQVGGRVVPALGGGNVLPVVPGSTSSSAPTPNAQTLPAGTELRLDVRGAGQGARPVLVPVGPPQGASTAPQQGNTALQQAAAVVPASPVQQAIAQTVQASVFRQDSISALLTSLAGLGGKVAELPKPVAQAAAELLGARVNLNGKPLDGSALKQAFQRSGVLLENFLGQGKAPPQGDIKSGLLKLVTALRSFLGDGASLKTTSDNRPPPPTSGATPRAAAPHNPLAQNDASPREAAARLLGQAEAALSRMRLTQLTSLPELSARAGQASGAASDLNLELPMLLGNELGVGQFQIQRDGKNGQGRDKDGSWKLKFSINFSQTGEVGATVSLRGKKVGVMLWAEREDMAEMLNDMSDELEEMLLARGLEPKAIRIRQGHPPAPPHSAGTFMDNRS